MTEILAPSGLSHSVAPSANAESVFLPAANIPDITVDGNHADGFATERRVGILLSELDIVKEVRQVEPGGHEDLKMVDLVVTMTEGFPIPQFFIQVKSSHFGVAAFFDDVGRRLDDEKPQRRHRANEEEYRVKKRWMAERRLIVINGGRKKRGNVTDDYIKNKFMREADAMVKNARASAGWKERQLESYLLGLTDIA